MPSAAPSTIAALIVPVLLSTCSKKVCSAGSAAGASLARSAFKTVNRMALCSVLREPAPSWVLARARPNLQCGKGNYGILAPRYKDDWRAFILKQKNAGDLTNDGCNHVCTR